MCIHLPGLGNKVAQTGWCKPVVLNLFGTRDRSRGRQFFHGLRAMVQVVMGAMESRR